MAEQLRDRALHIPVSIELTPRQVLTNTRLPELVPRNARVYLPDLGSTADGADVLEAAKHLSALGYRAVPHLAARRIASVAALERLVTLLAGEAGVSEVLVIAGGVKRPVGPFASSLALMETGILDRNGISEIAVAGHPEGCPDFSDSVAEAALKQKAEFARRTDATMRIVTQFGFDMERSLAWAQGIASTLPGIEVHLGMAGPAGMAALAKYAALCGVGNSVNFLSKRTGDVFSLVKGYSAEKSLVALETHLAGRRYIPVTQVHIYPFGGLEKASKWLLERGTWRASDPFRPVTSAREGM